MRSHSHRLGVAVVALVWLSGCGPAVIGEWESNERTKGEANRLTVEAEFAASASIFILRTVQGREEAQAFAFDVTWEERREGESYSFDLVCAESPYSGGCEEEDDFRMVCDLEGDDENQLACEARDNMRWEAYTGLAWHKVD